MADPADLIMRASVANGREAVATLDAIDTSAKRAEKSADGFTAGQSRMERQLQQADAALKQHQRELEATVVDFNAFYQASQKDFHSQWVRGARQFVEASNGAGRGARFASHEVANLGRQMADLGVMAAMGSSPLMLLVSQGPQIADVFSTARARGVNLSAALKDIALSAGRAVAAFLPVIAVVGAAAGAFLLWQKHSATLKEALEKTSEASENLGKVQAQATDALGRAAEFADKYKVANTGVTRALDAMIVSQNEASRETLAGIGSMDAAGQAALRRAELERLATVAILRRAAAEAEARAKDSDAAKETARKGAFGQGLITAFGFAGSPDMLAMAQQVEATEFKRLGGEAAAKAAQQEREWAKALREQADALANATLTIPPAKKAREGLTDAERQAAKVAREAARAEEEFKRAIEGVFRALESDGERTLREAHEKMVLLRRALDTGKISGDEYREAMDRIWRSLETVEKAQKAWNVELDKTPADLAEGVRGIEKLQDRLRDLRNAFDDVRFSIGDMFGSLKRGDIGGFLSNIQGLFGGIGAMLQQGPAGVMSLGSVAANAIGGKTGRAIGGGLGIAAGGLFAGSQLMGAASMGLLGSGALAGGAMALAPILGPIGLAAGALYAAAKIFNIGGKPSNNGAGFDLVTGQFSGNKRNAETEEAVRSAGEAIMAIQDALKAAGVGLKDAVTGLVIGTRDQTQIYLESGKTLRSAVGDSGAAVDTAMRALLESAEYASEGQRKVAEAALATGKGFDYLAEQLAKFNQAQTIGDSLADEILRLTEPRKFEEKVVRDAIEAQRKAAADLAKEGMLTAEQLAAINAQLTTLEGLQLGEVLKRFTNAAEQATFSLASDWDDARAATDAARSGLIDAYNREAQVHREAEAQYRQIAQGLREFGRELVVGAIAANDPATQYRRARAEFDRLAALAADDPSRLANIEGVGRGLIQASRAVSPSERAFNRDLQAVRAAVQASELSAERQADVAKQQLDALTAQVSLLVDLNANVLTVVEAIGNLQSALAVEGQLGAPANANINVSRYLANNPDLAANWMSGGVLRQLGGSLEEAAREHYLRTGQYEIAEGLREYADGGDHPGGWRLVGEEGPEIEATGPARYFSAEQTRSLLSGGDSTELVAAINRQSDLLSEQNALLRRTAKNTDDTAIILRRVTRDGDSLVTEAA